MTNMLLDVSTQSTSANQALVSLAAPASFAAEQYRGLRLKVERLRQHQGVRVLAITSPGINDGKTVTSINLAATFAHSTGCRVLLIDADLRRPSVGTYLGLSDWDRSGLSDALADGVRLEQVIHNVPSTPTLSVMPAGSRSAPVHELLQSERFEALLQEARTAFDLVIIDTPPLVPVTDALVMSRVVDGFLLVVAAHETPRKLLEDALNLVDASKVLGIVFNGDNARVSSRYNKYYER